MSGFTKFEWSERVALPGDAQDRMLNAAVDAAVAELIRSEPLLSPITARFAIFQNALSPFVHLARSDTAAMLRAFADAVDAGASGPGASAEQAMRQFQARGRTAIETLTEIAVATLQAETASKN